jgi:hypothetical protein
MIPPVTPNEISALATSTQQNREASVDAQAQGAPIAAPAQTLRPTQPTDASSASGDQQDLSQASSQRLQTENRTLQGSFLSTAEQARSAMQQVLQDMQQNPASALQAQGMPDSTAVAQLLAA